MKNISKTKSGLYLGRFYVDKEMIYTGASKSKLLAAIKYLELRVENDYMVYEEREKLLKRLRRWHKFLQRKGYDEK